MELYEDRPGQSNHQPWLLSFTVLVLIVFGTLSVLQSVAVALLPMLFGISIDQVSLLLGATLDHPNARLAYFFIKGLGGGFAFFVGGWIFIRFVDKKTLQFEKHLTPQLLDNLWIVFPILIGYILLNAILIYLNMNFDFPDFLSELEASLKAKEDQLMDLTSYTLDFDSFGEFLVGILVIGLLAGVGEEYLFRGIVQPKMHQYTRNAHWGVWITAFIFSLIHFQFYGFLPRLFLGVLFGYLYLYTGSLLYPMLAHISNNVMMVTLVYLNKLRLLEFSMGEVDTLKWQYIIVGLFVFIFSWYGLIKTNKNKVHR